jgi:hypothetical protein
LRKNQAVKQALDALDTKKSTPAPSDLVAILLRYLHQRHDLTDNAMTVTDIRLAVQQANTLVQHEEAIIQFFTRCDAARFADRPGTAPSALELKQLIFALEGVP